MIAYLDQHKDRYGVEPIGRVLPIAHRPTTTPPGDPLGPSRARRPAQGRDRPGACRAFGVYGARKVWRQLHREGITVARCTVGRRMGELHLEGVRRGKAHKTTTPMRPLPNLPTWWTSRRPGPTSCGSRI